LIDGIPIFADEQDCKRWDFRQVTVDTPLLLSPNRANYREDVLKNKHTYLSAPIREHTGYMHYAESWNRILDLGCGDGIYSAPLSETSEEIYCVDASLLALKRLKKRNKRNMFPVNASGFKLPFKNNFFDGVFYIYVIEHIDRPLEMLDEIHRVLKPEGTLLIVTDSKHFYQCIRIMIEFFKYRRFRPNDPTHINLMTPREMREIINKSKFISKKEELHYYLRQSRYKYVPKILAELFLTSSMVHTCKPDK